MAEETVKENETIPAGTETAPAAGTESPTQETNAETDKQISAFEKFMRGLFGDKKKEEPAKPKAEEPPAQDAKQYTQNQLQEMFAAEREKWQKEQDEKARLAKLSPEEQTKAALKAKEKEIAELKAQSLRRDLHDKAVAAFSADGYPVELAELVDCCSGEDGMKQSMETIQKVFKSCLETAVNTRLKGKTPEGLGGAAKPQNSLRDQIAKNIREGF